MKPPNRVKSVKNNRIACGNTIAFSAKFLQPGDGEKCKSGPDSQPAGRVGLRLLLAFLAVHVLEPETANLSAVFIGIRRC